MVRMLVDSTSVVGNLRTLTPTLSPLLGAREKEDYAGAVTMPMMRPGL